MVSNGQLFKWKLFVCFHVHMVLPYQFRVHFLCTTVQCIMLVLSVIFGLLCGIADNGLKTMSYNIMDT